MTPAYIHDVFGATGLLAARKPGYQVRPQQLQLAAAIDRALESATHLLAEAPTGVGKSLAYLVPLLSHATQGDSPRKVVVATASILLQEQLTQKDLPFLRETLPTPFTFAIAKGWSNFLCRDVHQAARDEYLKGRRLPVLQDQKQLEQSFDWADRTETGDLSELPFEPSAELKQRLTVSRDDCLGKACSYYDECFPREARKLYDKVDLLVSNDHLLFADLALKAMTGFEGGFLPQYSALVLDEAHKVVEIARSFFGQRITPGAVGRAVALLDAKGRLAEKLGIPARIDPDLRALVAEQADRLFLELSDLRHDEERYKARLDRPGLFDPRELCSSLRSAAGALERGAQQGGLAFEGRQALSQRADRCRVFATMFELAAGIEEQDGWIYYLDDVPSRRRAVALMAEPLHVSEMLRRNLFERERDKVTVVATSATLTTSDGPGGFDFVAGQLGAETADELVVSSPFDHSRACLVVPRMPPPNDRGFADAVAEQLAEAVSLAGGRTLGLFTSYRVLEACHRALSTERRAWRLLKQGDAPRSQLLAAFKADETSVLLGTESFWEGVDVPGPSLSLVFIDRIPFDHLLDPVADAMQAELGSKAFARYTLPRAKIMFRQGFGRLLRSVTDTGVVVCCDERLVSKPYGRGFVRALPEGVRVLRRLDQAVGYLPRTG